MGPREQRKDALPHGGLQINDWGSRALQAFMHHARFTGQQVTQRCHWESQGVPALFCTCAALLPNTDTSHLKDTDKRDWEQPGRGLAA